MFGILYYGAFLAYLLLSILVAHIISWLAKCAGSSGPKWGFSAFIIMIGVVFWDWIPMEVLLRYDCERYAGFTRYKTLDEWKVENPGVAETLPPIKKHKTNHDR
jgi:hypothetical protein